MTKQRDKAKAAGQGDKVQKKAVKARTPNQQVLMDSILDNHITMAVGPAGCGKTHISVGLAVQHLLEKKIKRIVITRPTVAADEELGALPGEIKDKMHPFLIPLYDELSYYLTDSEIKFYLENGIIEIAPIGFIRGRTMKNCYVILDEAQNCTFAQLKMALTRYGDGSKFIINGDHTQSDLPYHKRGGLKRCMKILENIENLGIVMLSRHDIVRAKIVQDMVDAFEEDDIDNDSNPK